MHTDHIELGANVRGSVPAVPAQSDEALVGRIAAGDRQAMQTLYRRHHVKAYRFVRRLVVDAALAEDLISEVFLDIWRQAARYEGRSSVSTWLLAIARNKAISAMRRRVDLELDDETASVLEDPADDPEVTVQKEHDRLALRECLAALSPAHREIIDLVYYHEKSVKEAAEILGISPMTVKTRMFYARKNLAKLLESARAGRQLH